MVSVYGPTRDTPPGQDGGGKPKQPGDAASTGERGRFNVLLTEDRPRSGEHWTHQLPRLMEPMGVAAYVARSGQQALAFAQQLPIHAAVIDMATPLGEQADAAQGSGKAGAFDEEPAGAWLMELLRRLPNRPPLVIVHGRTYSQRKVARLLNDALRMGAFSVLNKPVELEQLLAVFRRLLDRVYEGQWPDGRGS